VVQFSGSTIQTNPLIVRASSWNLFTGSQEQYLLSYKGLAFFAKSPVPLELPSGSEIVGAGSIWVPG
jgi:hypothetical protein